MPKLTRSFLLSAIAMGFLSCAQDVRPYDVRVKEALSEGLQEFNVKGASVAVILPDGKIHRFVAGYSNDSTAIEPEMLFAIGSITKNVVAALVLQLTEEGVLTLDDPISRWLPAYPYVDRTITIRQLLNHTSGLYMFWDNQKLWDDLKRYRDSAFSPEAVLTYIRDPYFSPGRDFRYSNTNYLLLAMICTRATNSTLSAEFRRRFWEPLKIEGARLSLEEQIPPNLAHVWGDNFENDGSNRDLTFLPRTSHESITYGSSGLFMTAEDLARWTHALFHGKVIGQDSLRQMQSFGRGAYGLGLGRFGFGVEDPVLAALLGHVHGEIGAFQQAGGLQAIVRIGAYPHAGRDGDPQARNAAGAAYGLQQFFRDKRDLLAVIGIEYADDEFVSPEPGDDVTGPDLMLHAAGDLLEQFVPRGMSQTVVDLLEAIQVDEQHAHQGALAFGAQEGLVQAIQQEHAVWQARQGVMGGHANPLGVDAVGLAHDDAGDQHSQQQGQAR